MKKNRNIFYRFPSTKYSVFSFVFFHLDTLFDIVTKIMCVLQLCLFLLW